MPLNSKQKEQLTKKLSNFLALPQRSVRTPREYQSIIAKYSADDIAEILTDPACPTTAWATINGLYCFLSRMQNINDNSFVKNLSSNMRDIIFLQLFQYGSFYSFLQNDCPPSKEAIMMACQKYPDQMLDSIKRNSTLRLLIENNINDESRSMLLTQYIIAFKAYYASQASGFYVQPQNLITVLESILLKSSDEWAKNAMVIFSELPITHMKKEQKSIYEVLIERLDRCIVVEDDAADEPPRKKIKISSAIAFQSAIEHLNWNALLDIFASADKTDLADSYTEYFKYLAQTPNSGIFWLMVCPTEIALKFLDNCPDGLIHDFLKGPNKLFCNVNNDTESIYIRILHLAGKEIITNYFKNMSPINLMTFKTQIVAHNLLNVFNFLLETLDRKDIAVYFPIFTTSKSPNNDTVFDNYLLNYFLSANTEKKLILLNTDQNNAWNPLRALALATYFPPYWINQFTQDLIDQDVSQPLPNQWTVLHLFARYMPLSIFKEVLLKTNDAILNKALALRLNGSEHSLLSLICDTESDRDLQPILSSMLPLMNHDNLREFWTPSGKSVLEKLYSMGHYKSFKAILDILSKTNLLDTALLENKNLAPEITASPSQECFEFIINKCSSATLYKIAYVQDSRGLSLFDNVFIHRTAAMANESFQKIHQPHLGQTIYIDVDFIYNNVTKIKTAKKIIEVIRSNKLMIIHSGGVSLSECMIQFGGLRHFHDPADIDFILEKLGELVKKEFKPRLLIENQYPPELAHLNSTSYAFAPEYREYLATPPANEDEAAYKLLVVSFISPFDKFTELLTKIDLGKLIDSGQLSILFDLLCTKGKDFSFMDAIFKSLKKTNNSWKFLEQISKKPNSRSYYFKMIASFGIHSYIFSQDIIRTMTDAENTAVYNCLNYQTREVFLKIYSSISKVSHFKTIMIQFDFLKILTEKASSQEILACYHENKEIFQELMTYKTNKGPLGLSHMLSLDDLAIQTILKELTPPQIDFIAKSISILSLANTSPSTMKVFFDVFKDYAREWQNECIPFLIQVCSKLNKDEFVSLFNQLCFMKDMKASKTLLNTIVCFHDLSVLDLLLKPFTDKRTISGLLKNFLITTTNFPIFSRKVESALSALQYAALYADNNVILRLLQYIDSPTLAHIVAVSNPRDAMMLLITDLFIDNPSKTDKIDEVHAKLFELLTPEILLSLSFTLSDRLKNKEALRNHSQYLNGLKTAYESSTLPIDKKLLDAINTHLENNDNYDEDLQPQGDNLLIIKLRDKMKSGQLHIKIVDPIRHQIFMDALKDYNNRTQLRYSQNNTPQVLFKYHHATGKILDYVNHKNTQKNKPPYDSTKKSSATMINSSGTTPVFGHHDHTRQLVGYLFDGNSCKVKAMFNVDVNTVQKYWYNWTIRGAEQYAIRISTSHFTNPQEFIQNINESKGKVNELLIKTKRESLTAIVICRFTEACRELAKQRQIEIYNELKLNLPIVYYDARTPNLRMVKDVLSQNEIYSIMNPQAAVFNAI